MNWKIILKAFWGFNSSHLLVYLLCPFLVYIEQWKEVSLLGNKEITVVGKSES